MAAKQPLDFDDAGADDSEPARGVTIGDVRRWHDELEALRNELAYYRRTASRERAPRHPSVK